jgi:hypothetical protein
MQLKIEMILQEVFDEKVSFSKEQINPKNKLETLNLFFQDEGSVIAKLD